MTERKFKFFDTAPLEFYEHVLKGDTKNGNTKTVGILDEKNELTVTLHEDMVEIMGSEWTENQCRVVQLEVRPDAVNAPSDGLCRCQVQLWDTRKRTLIWMWERDLKYMNLECADDLLCQFFRHEELAKLLSRYGIVLTALQ
jgi:hypothetical protein